MKNIRSLLLLLSCVWLANCGGHGPWSGSGGGDNPAGVPSQPIALAVNAGDGAVSLGWAAPDTNGADPITYNISVSPTASAQFTVVGTTAIVRGLSNNTAYTFAVTATNAAGTSVAASIQATPAKAASNYSAVTITRETDGPSEPSLLRASDGRVWLAYSGVRTNNGGQIVTSATRLALSADGGTSYTFSSEVGIPIAATSAVGNWLYRTPWLVEDSTDPNAARRFKLFAHKYFYDTANNIPNYDTGVIVMWTAAAPDGTWSVEQPLLGWDSTQTATFKINLLDTSLQTCFWVGEGSAAIYNGGIDFVFSCALDDSFFPARNIVLLRSIDHLASLTYVATLLQPADATTYSANSFSTPTLLSTSNNNAPLLLATPVDINGTSFGCVVLPIANESTGTLFTASSAPLSIQTLTPVNDGGRCAWDRGLLSKGILMGNRSGSTFTLQATGKSL